jgi:hypothetical protein
MEISFIQLNNLIIENIRRFLKSTKINLVVVHVGGLLLMDGWWWAGGLIAGQFLEGLVQFLGDGFVSLLNSYNSIESKEPNDQDVEWPECRSVKWTKYWMLRFLAFNIFGFSFFVLTFDRSVFWSSIFWPPASWTRCWGVSPVLLRNFSWTSSSITSSD